MDDLGDLDFNINCQTTTTSSSNDPENGGVPDWSKTETAWTPLPSAAGSGNSKSNKVQKHSSCYSSSFYFYYLVYLQLCLSFYIDDTGSTGFKTPQAESLSSE